MASFGQNTVYNYQRNAGFRRAGAFVEILNFDGPKHVILNKWPELLFRVYGFRV